MSQPPYCTCLLLAEDTENSSDDRRSKLNKGCSTSTLSTRLTSKRWHLDYSKELWETSSSDSDKETEHKQHSAGCRDHSVAIPEGDEDATASPRKPSSFVVTREKERQQHQCALCSVEFKEGVEVYVSNNPKCGHQFHKSCMDKWLAYQYTCPVCNEVYALQEV